MTAFIVAAVLLLLLGLLAWTPIGVQVVFDGELRIRAQFGILHVAVYPPRNTGKTKKTKRAVPAGTKSEEGGGSAKKPFRFPNRRQLTYTAEVLVPALGRVLHQIGLQLQVRQLRLHILFGGEDPADVALAYGRAQAAVSVLLPQVERLVRVKERQFLLSTDYGAERTVWSGILDIRLRLGPLLILTFSILKSLIVWLRGYRALSQEQENSNSEPSQPANASNAA